MPTADIVRQKALSLAAGGVPTDQAVPELLESCRRKRVPVVLARQQFLKDLEDTPADPVTARAADLLDQVLARLPLG